MRIVILLFSEEWQLVCFRSNLIMEKKRELSPAFVSSLIFIVSLALALNASPGGREFLEAGGVPLHQTPFSYGLLYFLVAVALLGVVLWLIPMSFLRIVLRLMFLFLFTWGAFMALFLRAVPLWAALTIALAVSVFWLLKPLVWLHDLVMVLALSSIGAVFGFIFSPWTAIALMAALSVYDILAVRSGYMLWMAKKLSVSEALPAFVIPNSLPFWGVNLRTGFDKLFETEAGEREFSILGGGDIGFPMLLLVSVSSVYGQSSALVVAPFSLFGLLSAYWIQHQFLKGKPMPALPPIFIASFIGFLIVHFLLNSS